ncbi:DUF3828 domain-containing protein [Lacibacterium aquatile]|uniref:DUF3828 domain-containing protein n=1 Tax=Lacibacterium aquatile TaxID=1168082 RepID=A0ABW5DU74_9PROT
MKRLFLCAVLVLAAHPVWAQSPASPKDIVQRLYKPYLDDPRAERTDTPGSMDAVLAQASKSLAKAIQSEFDCQTREEGVCNVDFDILINAQDWSLKKFAIAEKSRSGGKAVVVASFDNMGPMGVRFTFIQEGGTWKIDEMEGGEPKGSKFTVGWRLTEMLEPTAE